MIAYVRTPAGLKPLRPCGDEHVFHINKSCFQLEDSLAIGSRRSPNLR